MTQIDFAILNTNSNSNSYIAQVYQKHRFLCGKTEKF